MRRLKSQKRKNNYKPPHKTRVTDLGQYGGSQRFVNKINSKKRGFKKPKKLVRHYGKWLKIIPLILVISIATYFGIDLINESGYLKITQIELYGAKQFVNSEDMRKVIEANVRDHSYFKINTFSLEEKLKDNFLGAQTILVEKSFPRSIKVIVEERVPLAIIQNEKYSENFLVDKEGYILGFVVDEFMDLPSVYYDGEIEIGSFVNRDVIPDSIKIISASLEENLKISSMSFSPKYRKLYINEVVVLIGLDKDIEESLSVVRALVQTATLEGKNLSKIDLRYDKVIVLYK